MYSILLMVKIDKQETKTERMKSSTIQGLRILALTTLIATYLLIVLGSTVRVTESGMGCAGWPLCSGHIGPIDHFHPLLEQSHRYLAAIVTALIAAIAILSYRGGENTRHIKGPAFLAVGAIIVQIVLGAITVFTNNAPVTVALHLIVGLLFLGIVTVVTARAYTPSRSNQLPLYRFDRLAIPAVAALFIIFISGSLVVDGGAEKACPSWPLCFGSHAAGGLLTLQLIHRTIVFIGASVSAIYFIRIMRNLTKSAIHRKLAVTGLVLLAVEIVVGASVALLRAPDYLADIHLALAAALWTVTVATAVLAVPKDSNLDRAYTVTST
jgi:heme A synthase